MAGQGKKVRAKRLRREVGNAAMYRSSAAKRDFNRKVEMLKPDEVNGNALRRKRGLRTDKDCISEVCELVSQGFTIRETLQLVGLSQSQWGAWVLEDHEGCAAPYEAAKRMQAEAWADDLVEISESATHENYQGHKIRIDVKRWLMGKNNSRFADKNIVQGGDPGAPVRVIGTNMSPQEASEAYANTLKHGGSEPKPDKGDDE